MMLALFLAYIAVQVMLNLVAFAPEDEPVKTVAFAEKLPEFVAISVPGFRWFSRCLGRCWSALHCRTGRLQKRQAR